MANLTVRLLGPVSVAATSDGNECAVALGRSAEMLLCWLALHASHPVPREVVAAGLWPDADPDRARSRLSTALWRLKRPLAEAGVAAGVTGTETSMGLDRSAAVDVGVFETSAAGFLAKPRDRR